jgi:VWFA-related protein
MIAKHITRVSIGRLARFARIRLLAGWVAFAVAAAGPPRAPGQNKQRGDSRAQQEEPIHLKADLVEIRAVVTDKKGNKVTNLTKGDFEVTENKRPQVISFFSAENLKTREPSANQPVPNNRESKPRTGLPRNAGRTVVFFVDTFHLSNTSLLQLKQVMPRFIDTQLTESDLAGIVTSGPSLGLYGQFTQNREALHRAVDRLTVSGKDETFFTPYLAAKVEEGAPYAIDAAKNIVKAEEHLPDDPHFESLIELMARTRARQINVEASYRTRATLLALRAVAKKLSEMPGQRLIVMLSDGFTLLDSGGSIDSSELQLVVSRAALSGVVIYTIDAKGLMPLSFFDASRRGLTPDPQSSTFVMNYVTQGERDLDTVLVRIAHETGGEAFTNTNDLSGALKKSLDDNSFYYALSYYPSAAGDPKYFRTLKVTVKGHPEYVVRAQGGYFSSDLSRKGEEVSTDPEKTLVEAMNSPLAATGIDVSASADFFPLQSDKAQVTLSVFIGGEKLGYINADDSRITNLEFLIATIDASGTVTGITQDKTRVKMAAASFESANQRTYRYAKRLALKPGTYQVRIAVRNTESGLIGTAAAWVHVPKVGSKKLVLSGLLTGRIERKGATPATAISQPNVVDGLNLFHTTDTLIYKCRAYKEPLTDADINGLSAQVQIIQGGQVVFEDKSRPLSSLISSKQPDSLEFSGQLALQGMKPGYSEFRVTVTDSKSGQSIASTAGIEIR